MNSQDQRHGIDEAQLLGPLAKEAVERFNHPNNPAKRKAPKPVKVEIIPLASAMYLGMLTKPTTDEESWWNLDRCNEAIQFLPIRINTFEDQTQKDLEKDPVLSQLRQDEEKWENFLTCARVAHYFKSTGATYSSQFFTQAEKHIKDAKEILVTRLAQTEKALSEALAHNHDFFRSDWKVGEKDFENPTAKRASGGCGTVALLLDRKIAVKKINFSHPTLESTRNVTQAKKELKDLPRRVAVAQGNLNEIQIMHILWEALRNNQDPSLAKLRDRVLIWDHISINLEQRVGYAYMPLLEHGTLFDAMCSINEASAGPLTEDVYVEYLSVWRGALEALEIMFKSAFGSMMLPIFYRDTKSDNVFLKQNNSGLLDFGFAGLSAAAGDDPSMQGHATEIGTVPNAEIDSVQFLQDWLWMFDDSKSHPNDPFRAIFQEILSEIETRHAESDNNRASASLYSIECLNRDPRIWNAPVWARVTPDVFWKDRDYQSLYQQFFERFLSSKAPSSSSQAPRSDASVDEEPAQKPTPRRRGKRSSAVNMASTMSKKANVDFDASAEQESFGEDAGELGANRRRKGRIPPVTVHEGTENVIGTEDGFDMGRRTPRRRATRPNQAEINSTPSKKRKAEEMDHIVIEDDDEDSTDAPPAKRMKTQDADSAVAQEVEKRSDRPRRTATIRTYTPTNSPAKGKK